MYHCRSACLECMDWAFVGLQRIDGNSEAWPDMIRRLITASTNGYDGALLYAHFFREKTALTRVFRKHDE